MFNSYRPAVITRGSEADLRAAIVCPLRPRKQQGWPVRAPL